LDVHGLHVLLFLPLNDTIATNEKERSATFYTVFAKVVPRNNDRKGKPGKPITAVQGIHKHHDL
jgi:hypothetical protein